MAPWRPAPLFVLSCFLAVACGGNSVSGPTRSEGGGGGNTENPGQAITVRGGERLVWDQVAISVQAVQSLTFTLWVDGAAMPLTSVSCNNTRTAAGYECSGGLPSMAPGRHSLELSAIATGRESTRSSPIAIMMASSSEAPE